MPLLVLDCAFEGCDLDIWRYTMRHLLQQRSPVETPINECVERFGRANDAVQFFGTFLGGCHFRFHFRPLRLHDVQPVLALECLVAFQR